MGYCPVSLSGIYLPPMPPGGAGASAAIFLRGEIANRPSTSLREEYGVKGRKERVPIRVDAVEKLLKTLTMWSITKMSHRLLTARHKCRMMAKKETTR